jgi:hypothetical protein
MGAKKPGAQGVALPLSSCQVKRYLAQKKCKSVELRVVTTEGCYTGNR